VLKMTGGGGITVGLMLLGAARPAHVLTPSGTSGGRIESETNRVVQIGTQLRCCLR